MPVPENVTFGPADGGGTMTYGEVRALSGEEKLTALRRRLDSFFVSQVDELGRHPETALKVYSPFPLFLMTCVGIETVGQVFFWRPSGAMVSKEAIQRQGFVSVCTGIHGHFSRPLDNAMKSEFDALWGVDAHQYTPTIAAILHRFGRNTMIHGYQSQGVFLSEEVEEWKWEDGYVVLNQYWFWDGFKREYAKCWDRLHANKEPKNPMRLSAMNYTSVLLD